MRSHVWFWSDSLSASGLGRGHKKVASVADRDPAREARAEICDNRTLAGVAELADARDLKSRDRKVVRVRFPAPAVHKAKGTREKGKGKKESD